MKLKVNGEIQSLGDIDPDTPLLWEDDNHHRDVYRYAVASQRLELVSLGSNGRAGDGASHSPRLEDAGQRIIFVSSARNLVGPDTYGFSQLYLYDPMIRTLTLLSADLDGSPGSNDSDQPALGGDWLFFRTDAHNLGPDGPGLYRQHLADGWRQLVGLDDWGIPDPLASHPAVDARGKTLIYQRPDERGSGQIYLSDTSNAVRLSDSVQRPAPSHCCAAISADGAFVAYRQTAADGSMQLRVTDIDCAVEASLPWPALIGPRQQPPRFSEDGTVIGWINPVQDPTQPGWLSQLANPVYRSNRCEN